MRLMGTRMGSVLTRNEMIAMISLAAANGVALMAPDRGLLPVVVIAAVIIGYQQFIAWRAFRNKKFESLVLDDLSVLVEDGRLQLDKLEEGVLCRTQVLAKLRKDGIANLGNVRRAYQEANGSFSILTFKDEKRRPGLSIVPATDTAFREEQEKAPGQFACASCGHLQAAKQTPAADCPRCQQREWEPAVLG